MGELQLHTLLVDVETLPQTGYQGLRYRPIRSSHFPYEKEISALALKICCNNFCSTSLERNRKHIVGHTAGDRKDNHCVHPCREARNNIGRNVINRMVATSDIGLVTIEWIQIAFHTTDAINGLK